MGAKESRHACINYEEAVKRGKFMIIIVKLIFIYNLF